MSSPPGYLPLVMGGVLFLGEAPTWPGYKQRIQPSQEDAGTLQVNNLLGWSALVAGAGAALLARGRPTLSLPAWVTWAGVPVTLLGTALRVWAMRTLGELFTLTLQVRPEQPVIQHGPYRLVRHPSYAGGELALLGLGLSCGNWLSPLLFVVPWLAAHLHRMPIEEAALERVLGAPYREYSSHTWRLLPFLY
ncbi:methyltransferase family protein [Archangium minus]